MRPPSPGAVPILEEVAHLQAHRVHNGLRGATCEAPEQDVALVVGADAEARVPVAVALSVIRARAPRLVTVALLPDVAEAPKHIIQGAQEML